MSPTVLYHGLIFGYTAPRAAFVPEKRLTESALLKDIAADFRFLDFQRMRLNYEYEKCIPSAYF
jgi:hypothetical protein